MADSAEREYGYAEFVSQLQGVADDVNAVAIWSTVANLAVRSTYSTPLRLSVRRSVWIDLPGLCWLAPLNLALTLGSTRR
jgi:hypothetical protein